MPETLDDDLTDDPAAEAPVGRTGLLRRVARTVPLGVWALTGLWCVLLLGASVVWPMSYGSDEPQHVDMAYDYAAHPFTFYGPGQLELSQADVGMQHSVPGYPPQTRLAQAPIPSRPKRPSFAQLGGHSFEKGGQPNQMDQHPPLYYWVEAVVLILPGVSGLAWDLQVWLMRLVSIVIMAPVPLLCWATARRLLVRPFGRIGEAGASRLAVLAAALPLTVPDLVRDGSSVDNDTLLILSVSVVAWGLARAITGDLRLRTATVVGIALAVGLWTKGFALALPPIILIAYLLGVRGEGVGWRRRIEAAWRPVAVCALGALVGSFWWIRNVIDYHTVQPNGFGAAYTLKYIYGPRDYQGTLPRFVPTFVDEFTARIWGQIGLPDSPSAGPLIVYGWLFVCALGLVAALSVRTVPGTRRRLAVLALVPLAFFALTFQGSYNTFRQWAHDGVRSSSGRYIYPGIVVIGALFAIGWSQILRPRFLGRLPLYVAAGALATNAAVWLLILRSWYGPATDKGFVTGTHHAFGALLRWSPLPDAMTVLLVLALPLAAGAVCLAVLAREARRWPPARDVAQDIGGNPVGLGGAT